MPERGTKYKGSTPSNPLFGKGMDGPAHPGPGGPGVAPQYGEARDGLAPQAGGDMPEWDEALSLGVDVYAPSTIDHVKRIDKGADARLRGDESRDRVLASVRRHRQAQTHPIDKDD
jgi:hypothetical protein